MIAGALVAAAALVGFGLAPKTPTRASDAVEARDARAALSNDAPPEAAPASTPAQPASSARAPAASEPPDGAKLPEDRGYLFVESASALPVYVNGVLAGDANRWLVVHCGFRNVRLAETGPSPVGRSFPRWATEGNSVLVPCRGATRAAF